MVIQASPSHTVHSEACLSSAASIFTMARESPQHRGSRSCLPMSLGIGMSVKPSRPEPEMQGLLAKAALAWVLSPCQA